MNTSIIAQQNNNSPFDSIRHWDSDGEYWLGRELMPLLGYLKWQKFKQVIENAKDNLAAADLDPNEHFLPVEVKSSGRAALDYKITRLAAYHIALSCDSRGKEAVKLAKHYFAIKTREAEVVIFAQNDRLREMELQLKLMELKNSMVTMHGKELTLRLMGDTDAIIERETVVTEVVEPATGRCTKFLNADQLKRAVKERTGQNLKSMKQFTDALRAKGRDDLLIAVTRHSVSEYVQPEHLDEAIAVAFQNKQFLLGENS